MNIRKEMEGQIKNLNINQLKGFVAKINNTNILTEEFSLYWKFFLIIGDTRQTKNERKI